MATVATEPEHPHPQVMTVKEGGHVVPVPETDRPVSDGRKRLESDSEVDDRASDVESDIGPERRCTSASGAGESEYESVDEGDESPKQTAPRTCPEMIIATSAASDNHTNDHSDLSIPSDTKEKRTQEPICIKSHEPITKKSTPLRNMCWADVSDATDSLEVLIDNELEESALKIGKVIENELEIKEKKSSSAEAEALCIREEDDDEDENYEDIESDVSELQSSREEVVESEEEEEEIGANGDGERGQKEDGDDEDEDESSSEQPSKPLDDDEDMRKPQYIPKRGAFYEHDDRLGSDEEGNKAAGDRESVTSDSSQPKSAKPLTISNKKSNPVRTSKDHSEAKVVNVDAERWGHDMFREDEQKPKSREELLTSYGYDIRSQEAGHQKAVRYNKRGVTHTRSSRSWKDESDRSPHTSRSSEDQPSAKPNPTPAPSSRANEKIAMREAHQESERRRYERESKPPQRESLQRDRTSHRLPETGNRRNIDRPTDRPDRRQNEDMSSASRNSAPRRPFNRDDFPELTSQRPADFSQKKSRDDAGAWNRNISNNSSSRRRDQSSDESQERPVVRTAVYSSSRFTKDNRSPKSDTHHSYSLPTNGSHKNKFDRPDRTERNDHRETRQSAGYRKSAPPPPRPNESANRSNDPDGRNDRSQRNNRREYQSDRGSNRQFSRKDNDDPLPRTTDPVNELSAGIQKLAVDQRNNQRRQPAADGQITEPESRPKRYSATRSQQQPQQPPLSQANMSCPAPVSHHPAIAHQQMPPQVNPPPPHQYFDPGPQSPPEYYPEAEGPAYAPYPADASGFMAHHSRYIPSHPGAPASNPLNPAPPPLAVMPGTAAAFLPTFTPSLPPSGFPQYPPPQQYHHAMGPPVPGPPPPPGSEMFRGGVTYYDTTQQQPLRSLPPKRPKNILPILPPPDIDGHQQDLTHPDSANPGY